MNDGARGLTLRPARDAADYAAFADLCRGYLDWCRTRYADLDWFVAEVFGHQSMDDELARLGDKYGPPKGLTLVAERDGEIVGAGAWHRLDDGTCEMKRLFVSDAARGTGAGRRLAQALVDAARDSGFALMRLDTGDRLTEAQALYTSLGFAYVKPYLDYPDHLLPHLVFMERRL